jgi:hypothetical protein
MQTVITQLIEKGVSCGFRSWTSWTHCHPSQVDLENGFSKWPHSRIYLSSLAGSWNSFFLPVVHGSSRVKIRHPCTEANIWRAGGRGKRPVIRDISDCHPAQTTRLGEARPREDAQACRCATCCVGCKAFEDRNWVGELCSERGAHEITKWF